MPKADEIYWAQKKSIWHREQCRQSIDLIEAREHLQKAERFEREAADIRKRLQDA